jgi:hypothetical protein
MPHQSMLPATNVGNREFVSLDRKLIDNQDRQVFFAYPTNDFIVETWKNCIIINYLFFNNTVMMATMLLL